eukprot:CAMPEP_0119048590 /NCGR_PEP_ID=MMETSP1177-20130426/59749_1 /TAXON_ID=2985 /ORGANISM="Ochromonas sp, Strain CCMP1899" /LENGTH=387 /DNA_ID=CAMNT_0007024695 /DNA_START=69 /DNA_END=1232 /DNA_ORIENTATION=-
MIPPPPPDQQQGERTEFQQGGPGQGYPNQYQQQYPGEMQGQGQGMQQEETPSQPPHLLLPSEPQVIMVEDCIVMILKPQEFYRKKAAFTEGGGGNMQVFSDFEHVLTQTQENGARTVSSGELLECAQNVLSPNAVAQLRAVSADFALVEEGDMDEAQFEDFSARCQAIVAREGHLHIASVAPATRDLLPRLGMRDGWKETLTALAQGGVPTFVFSSGYGDVIAQALLQGGLGSDGGGGQTLPQNLRIISNFFRTAPDGTVRAFSQPVVHERNKNASTATRHMGMPVPDRPHALVFGSHEDDLLMTEGASGIRDQISVGFLELADDLTVRLPNFLNAFDAVVLGEGSFYFAKSLVEDILQIAPPTAIQKQQQRMSILDRLNGLSPDMF